MKRQSLLPGTAAALVLGASALASPSPMHNHVPVPAVGHPVSLQNVTKYPIDLDRTRVNDPDPIRLHTDVPDLPRAGSGSSDSDWFVSPFAPVEKVVPEDVSRELANFFLDGWSHRAILPSGRTSSSTYKGDSLWTAQKGGDRWSIDQIGVSLPGTMGSTHFGFFGNDSVGADRPVTGFAIPSPASVSLLVFGSLAATRRRRR